MGRTWQLGTALLMMGTACALITGCSVGPDYVRPTMSAAPVFKEMSGWKRATPGGTALPANWWEMYRDPELNRLEEQVVLSNQNLAVAEAQFRQARALVNVARAGFLPTVTVGASATRTRRPVTVGGTTTTGTVTGGSATGSSEAITFSTYSLPVDATWELDLWGRVRRSVEANEASSEANLAQVGALLLSIQAELAQDYFQLRTLDAESALLKTTVAAYAEFLQLTVNRAAVGVASQADVLQAEAQLKNAQALALDVVLQRAQLEHAIALLLGKPGSLFSLPAIPLAGTPPSIPVSIPSDLLERRPDIAAAERRMASANAQIGVAEAAFFPSITLSASAGFQAASLSRWLTWPSRFWSLGGNIAETIFSGGIREAQVAAAKAAYDATVAAYRQTVLTAFQEVEDNLAALRILEEEEAVQQDALRAAQESTRIAINQYQAGTATYLNVIIAQTTELSSARNAVSIGGRRMAASVLLIKALGGGW